MTERKKEIKNKVYDLTTSYAHRKDAEALKKKLVAVGFEVQILPHKYEMKNVGIREVYQVWSRKKDDKR